MKFICIDTGASSTRYISDSGKLGILPNNVVFLSEEEVVDMEPYSNKLEDALEVIVDSDNRRIFPKRALMGSLANRYSSTNLRPTVLSNKHTQEINYLSAIVSTALAVHRNNLENPEIMLYWALPPIEVQTAKDKVRENCVGTYTVAFPKHEGGLTVKFKITDVQAYEESFMALLSYFFDTNGALKEQSKKYSTGNVLSLDIGASSTDLAIVTDMRFLEKSGQTYKTGGNIAREFLSDDIRAIYGFDISNELAEYAIAEGRIRLGNNYENIGELVESSKRKLAEQVVEQMQGYFRKVGIPIQSIRAIVVSGGGSMRGQYIDEEGREVITSRPMSHFITEALNGVCSGIDVESLGSKPRLAVITGMFIRANADQHKRNS